MRKHFMWVFFLSAVSLECFGRTWQLDASTLKLATAILDRDLTGMPSSGKIQVDRDHQAESYEVSFQIPRGVPSFLVVTTTASRSGRLTIHLQPGQLPVALQSAIPKEDWANPNRLYDFRTVVELREGAPQEHVVSLNRDFFESVTRAKRPFDLAGLQIKRVAFHRSVPVEDGQRFEVLRIQGWGLTGKAAGDYLAGLARRLRARWEGLPVDSPVRSYWASAVEQATKRVRALDPAGVDDRSFWTLQGELGDLLLRCRSWLVDPGSRSGYLVGLLRA